MLPAHKQLLSTLSLYSVISIPFVSHRIKGLLDLWHKLNLFYAMCSYQMEITVSTGSTYLNYKGIHMCSVLFFNRAIAISIISTIFSSTEMLEGQSAFRLKSPFLEQGDQKLLSRYHAPPEDRALEVNDLSPKPSQEATTNKSQWYSTEEGMQLFGKIHGALQEYFEVRPSRDTTTHDICLSLKSGRREIAVDFPHNFPQASAILIEAGNRRKQIILKKASSQGGNTESFKDKKPPNSANDKATEDTDAEGNLGAAKISQSPPSSVQDDKNEKGAKANGSLDPGEIPQLLVEKIRSLLLGTNV